MDDLHDLSDEDLWGRLTEVTGRDRVEVLFELGNRASQREDFVRASTLWQEIETAADELGDGVLGAESLRLQGGAAFYSGDYEHAVELYERAAHGFSDSGASRDAASSLWCLADAYRMLGDYENQLVAAGESRALAEFEDAGRLCADACFMQAKALYFLNRDSEALEACRSARDRYRAATRPDQVASVDDFTVSVHLSLGNLDDALELSRGCLVLAQMSSSEADDAYARYRLAEVFRSRGDLDEALEQAGLAKAAYRTRDDFVGVGKCAQLEAEAHVDRDEPVKALHGFADARVLFDATGRDHDALRCDARTSMLLHYIGDYRKAARLNEALVQAYRDVDAVEPMRWSVVRLLDNLLEDGQPDECLTVAQEHMGVWPEGTTAVDSSYREFLGLYAIALERAGKADQATAVASHVIANTPAREASIGTAYCYEVRGRSRLEADEAAAGQDFSHAIALHLARGRVDRARELSQYFLPVDGDGGTDLTREDDRAVEGGPGHG